MTYGPCIAKARIAEAARGGRGKAHRIFSPAVYIPQGTVHEYKVTYRLIGGSGQAFNIVPEGSYNGSLI